jgi:hypothetical protein
LDVVIGILPDMEALSERTSLPLVVKTFHFGYTAGTYILKKSPKSFQGIRILYCSMPELIYFTLTRLGTSRYFHL